MQSRGLPVRVCKCMQLFLFHRGGSAMGRRRTHWQRCRLHTCRRLGRAWGGGPDACGSSKRERGPALLTVRTGAIGVPRPAHSLADESPLRRMQITHVGTPALKSTHLPLPSE